MTERRKGKLSLLRRIGLLLLAGAGVVMSFRHAGIVGLIVALAVVLLIAGLLTF